LFNGSKRLFTGEIN